jgi:hypothetical protein
VTDGPPASNPPSNRATLPDLVVFGVGHSGTSIATRMLFELGWRPNGADERFCEPPGITDLDDRILEAGPSAATRGAIDAFLAGLESPFAIKDPRLVLTLPAWAPALLDRRPAPALLWITRGVDDLLASYAARDETVDGAPGLYGRTVEELVATAAKQFDAWPSAKLRLAYEDLARAVRLFRVEPGQRHPLGGLWV